MYLDTSQKNSKLLAYAEQINLDLFPGYSNIVSTASCFVKACSQTVKMIGFKTNSDILGVHYANMPCQASEHAKIFEEEDRLALKNKIQILTYQQYNGEWKLMLASKTPINLDGETLGLLVNFSDLTQTGLIDITRFFKKIGSSYNRRSFSMIINRNHLLHRLTPREHECLFYLCRGSTYKEIGTLLNIGISTVQTHLESIKIKMEINKKSALIEKAIDLGLNNILPKSII